MKLDQAGIQVSMGAACAAGGMDPSHVLLALGLNADTAAASLRFSLSRYSKAPRYRRRSRCPAGHRRASRGMKS